MDNTYWGLVPGFVQGIVRVGVSYPFDSMKVYMQKGIYRSTISAFSNIIKTDPVVLFRGSSVSFVVVPIDKSVKYYCIERLNKKFNPYISGLIMGAVTPVYYSPLNYITTNAVLTEKSKYSGISNFLRSLTLKKIYKGSTLEFSRSLIGSSMYLGTYMTLRNRTDKKYQVYMAPIYGTLSTTISAATWFPIDSVRTDLQTTSNKTIYDVIRDKYHSRGFRGFYSGLTPVIIKSIPSVALGMLAYEGTKNLLNLTT